MTDKKAKERRNSRLLQFFRDNFQGDFQVIGSVDTPTVIYNNKHVMSCYVLNFHLYFTDKPKDGKVVYQVKLTEINMPDHDKLFNWFNNCEHRPCYSVKVKGTELRLSGYNFTNKENKENPKGRYPVFSEKNYKLYYSKEKAEEIVNDYQSETLDLIVD